MTCDFSRYNDITLQCCNRVKFIGGISQAYKLGGGGVRGAGGPLPQLQKLCDFSGKTLMIWADTGQKTLQNIAVGIIFKCLK